jgi:hypothetical protein
MRLAHLGVLVVATQDDAHGCLTNDAILTMCTPRTSHIQSYTLEHTYVHTLSLLTYRSCCSLTVSSPGCLWKACLSSKAAAPL